MNVTQLLKKLRSVANIEIAIPLLPEMCNFAEKLSRNALLQALQNNCQRSALGFAEKQMHVLRHYYVSIDIEIVHSTYAFKSRFKGAGRLAGGKNFPSAIAAERYEMSLPRFVEAMEFSRHIASA